MCIYYAHFTILFFLYLIMYIYIYIYIRIRIYVCSLTVCVTYYCPTVWITCSPRTQGANHCLLLLFHSRETGFLFNFECPSNARALSDCSDNRRVFGSGPLATLSCGLNGE